MSSLPLLDAVQLAQAERVATEKRERLEAEAREAEQERALLQQQRKAVEERTAAIAAHHQACKIDFLAAVDSLMKRKVGTLADWFNLAREIRKTQSAFYRAAEWPEETRAEAVMRDAFCRVTAQSHPIILGFEWLKILIIRDFPDVPSN